MQCISNSEELNVWGERPKIVLKVNWFCKREVSRTRPRFDNVQADIKKMGRGLEINLNMLTE
jgi:hypothetical protein